MKAYEKDTKIVRARPGEAFKVRLPTLSAGGYTWEVQPAADQLRLLSRVVQPGNAEGAEAVTEFTFEAQDAGETTLVFQYGRPWESAKSEAWQMKVAVEPDEKPPA